jgi:hypothetical protein
MIDAPLIFLGCASADQEGVLTFFNDLSQSRLETFTTALKRNRESPQVVGLGRRLVACVTRSAFRAWFSGSRS